MTDEYGPWEPLTLDEVVSVFAPASFRWWITGGHALDLHLGRTWRSHEDTDVGVSRRDHTAWYELLQGWNPHIAAAGKLTPWDGGALERSKDQNNVWCRRTVEGPWVLDLQVGEESDEQWIYRRDPSVVLAWEQAVLLTPDGVPYLAPELQLLYKSKDPRPKDDVDAAEVIPSLEPHRRQTLSRLLDPKHPWRRLLT